MEAGRALEETAARGGPSTGWSLAGNVRSSPHELLPLHHALHSNFQPWSFPPPSRCNACCLSMGRSGTLFSLPSGSAPSPSLGEAALVHLFSNLWSSIGAWRWQRSARAPPPPPPPPPPTHPPPPNPPQPSRITHLRERRRCNAICSWPACPHTTLRPESTRVQALPRAVCCQAVLLHLSLSPRDPSY